MSQLIHSLECRITTKTLFLRRKKKLFPIIKWIVPDLVYHYPSVIVFMVIFSPKKRNKRDAINTLPGYSPPLLKDIDIVKKKERDRKRILICTNKQVWTIESKCISRCKCRLLIYLSDRFKKRRCALCLWSKHVNITYSFTIKCNKHFSLFCVMFVNK